MSNQLLEDAVKAAQLYAGATGVHIKDAQRLYKRMFNKICKVADTYNISTAEASDQIAKEARKRGPITPIPAKDY